MTSPENGNPPSVPVIDQAPPTPGTAVNVTNPVTNTGVQPAHWSRGAWQGASRLITTAANDELVRNMIGSRARSQVAATVFGGTVLGAVAARIATRSVPGALLVGGALLAKAIYDKRKAKSNATIGDVIANAKAKVTPKR